MENSMHRAAWQATIHVAAKSLRWQSIFLEKSLVQKVFKLTYFECRYDYAQLEMWYMGYSHTCTFGMATTKDHELKAWFNAIHSGRKMPANEDTKWCSLRNRVGAGLQRSYYYLDSNLGQDWVSLGPTQHLACCKSLISLLLSLFLFVV